VAKGRDREKRSPPAAHGCGESTRMMNNDADAAASQAAAASRHGCCSALLFCCSACCALLLRCCASVPRCSALLLCCCPRDGQFSSLLRLLICPPPAAYSLHLLRLHNGHTQTLWQQLLQQHQRQRRQRRRRRPSARWDALRPWFLRRGNAGNRNVFVFWARPACTSAGASCGPNPSKWPSLHGSVAAHATAPLPVKKERETHNSGGVQVQELIPESEQFTKLVEFERRLDALVARKRTDIQEALRRPKKVHRSAHQAPARKAVGPLEQAPTPPLPPATSSIPPPLYTLLHFVEVDGVEVAKGDLPIAQLHESTVEVKDIAVASKHAAHARRGPRGSSLRYLWEAHQ
jgi:hypothetical protein